MKKNGWERCHKSDSNQSETEDFQNFPGEHAHGPP